MRLSAIEERIRRCSLIPSPQLFIIPLPAYFPAWIESSPEPEAVPPLYSVRPPDLGGQYRHFFPGSARLLWLAVLPPHIVPVWYITVKRIERKTKTMSQSANARRFFSFCSKRICRFVSQLIFWCSKFMLIAPILTCTHNGKRYKWLSHHAYTTTAAHNRRVL